MVRRSKLDDALLLALNYTLKTFRFKMLNFKAIMSFEDWFVTIDMIDMKNTQFHVEIVPQHKKHLGFAFCGEVYQYRELPFGLALSPQTFKKCINAALSPL